MNSGQPSLRVGVQCDRLEKTQYRIDHSPFRKCYYSPEGYLYAEATFARDGILEYSNADGSKRRELRLPEENKKALTGFGRKPFTVEHPSTLVNSVNSKQLSVGLTDPEVVYDKSGFVRGVITVTDSAAVDLIQSGQKPEVSVGYQCRLENTPGVWQGERYDAIQRDIVVNHVCCTAKGRAGGDVRIHLDSETEDMEIAYLTDSLDTTTPTGGRMATLTIDNATYDVPAELAPVITNQLSKLDSLKEEVERLRSDNKEMQSDLKEAQGRVDSLSEELVEAIDRADTQEGRADRFEEIVDDSISLLGEEGYQWNGDSATFVREDGKGKGKKKMPWMEEEGSEEEMESPDEEEDEQMPASYKKKKQDGCETPMKQDSVDEIVAAILEAEAICPGIRQDSDLSATSVRSIQEMVISRLDADYDLTEASDGYVAGVYFALTQDRHEDAAEDNQPSYAQQAMQAVTTSSPAPRQDAVETFAGASGARMAAAWQKPLR